MPVMFRLWVALGVFVALGNCSDLVEFNEQFANRSAESTVLVQTKWRENGLLNGVLNEQIVIRMGEMVSRMRAANMESLQMLQQATELDDACREYLEQHYEMMQPVQNRDIQLCAIYAYSNLFADSITRFQPRAKFLHKLNTDAQSQVVRSLAERDLMEIGLILEEELATYEGILDEHFPLLQKDLDDHSEVLQKTLNDLENCRSRSYVSQDSQHDFIEQSIASNCQ